MPLFEDIYQAAINQDVGALRQFPLFDRVHQQTAPFITVAGLLARQNNVEAVKFLQKNDPDISMNYIAEGYAYARNHDMVRECEEAGANIDDIAVGYAIAGDHDRVKHYLEAGARLGAIVCGYAFGGHHEIAEEYLHQNPDDNLAEDLVWSYANLGDDQRVQFYENSYPVSPIVIARGYAVGNHHEKAEEYLRKDPSADAIYELVGTYAEAGNHERVRFYEENYNASLFAIAKGYAAGRYHQEAELYLLKIIEPEAFTRLLDELLWVYAAAGNSAQIKYYEDRYETNLTAIARGYASGGHHAEAEACLDRIEDQEMLADLIDELVWVYAKAGNYERVSHYEVNHGVNQNVVITAYALGGHDEAVEDLLQPGDDIVSLAENAAWGYAYLGNHSKVEDLLARYPQIDRKLIVEGYEHGGFNSSAALYQAQLANVTLIENDDVKEDLTPPAVNQAPLTSNEDEVPFSSDEDDEPVSGFQGGAYIRRAHVSIGDDNDRLQQSPAAEDEGEGTLLDTGVSSVVVRELAPPQASVNTNAAQDEQNNNGLGQVPAEVQVDLDVLQPGLANNNMPVRNNQGWLDSINMQVLSLFVAGVGATAVAAAVVALALQAVTFPVGMAIVAVGAVATAVGGFGFFKYSPEPPAAPITPVENNPLTMG